MYLSLTTTAPQHLPDNLMLAAACYADVAKSCEADGLPAKARDWRVAVDALRYAAASLVGTRAVREALNVP